MVQVPGIDTIHAIERDQSKEIQRSQVHSSQQRHCIAHAMSNELESGIQSYDSITNNRKHAWPTRRTHLKRPKQNFPDIHGDPLGTKDNEDVCIIWKNWDGIAPWQPRNDNIMVA